jgi:hypothetical protein
MTSVQRPGFTSDACRQVAIEQKMLAERAAGIEACPCNDLTKWRQRR